MNSKNNTKCLLTIGMPVYNGEKSIRNSLDSLLSQSFKNFELIISDNASTDSTPIICTEYLKKDSRIKYIRRDKNFGGLNNFLLLLDQATTEYFMWAAIDDLWESTFLEKNIQILETRKDVVASIGKINIIGDYYDKFNYDQNDDVITKFYKKFRQHFLSVKYYGTSATKYEDRVRMCLKSFRYAVCIYSIFRTTVLKKSANYLESPWDWVVILRVLQYGNLHVIDEVLSYRSLGGISNTNSINVYLHKDIKFSQILFPKIPFTKWCIKNLGRKIFLQNIIFFIRLNYSGLIIIMLDLIKYLKSRNNKKPYRFEWNDENPL